jgi:hypothetical protein
MIISHGVTYVLVAQGFVSNFTLQTSKQKARKNGGRLFC